MKKNKFQQKEFSFGVVISDKDNFEKALGTFKQKIKDSGILQEYKDRQTFHKKSEIKRKQKQKAIRKNQFDLNNES